MSGLRRDTLRSVGSSLLPWEPPNLSSPRIVTVTSDPATRYIELADGEDLLLQFTEETRFDFEGPMGLYSDAMVTVLGGRNVVAMGAHFIGEPGPIQTLDVGMAADDMQVHVGSTAGYPASGMLRIDGELISYSSKNSTTFNVLSRRAGYFLTSANSSDTTHSAGAKVYLGEYSRTALSMRTQTGKVHLEGIRADGFLCDGLRIRGTATTTVQMQNFHIGPVTNHEKVDWTDGHPDCVQTWGNGAAEVKLANGTLIAGRAGKCIENAADTTTGTAVGKFTLRNVEFIDEGTNFLVYARSTPTVWDVANAWCVTDLPKDMAIRKAGDQPDPVLAPMIGVEPARMSGKHFVQPSDIGVGYNSPGYVS